MALSRTIIRTYALSQVARPDRVLTEANARIMQDTHGSHFVTAFYAILDPRQGTLDYANAGHNPPHLSPLRRQDAEPIRLIRTGIPLGILTDAAWGCESVRMLPGDALVLYTDGVTEAQDRRQVEFGEARLAEVLQDQRGQPATEIQQAILRAVRDFVGTAPQSDDLAVMVLVRGEASTAPDEHYHRRGSNAHV
jgi:phosphoserine phosphatase RsbU/P